jgi:hypothetical protein
MMRKETFRVDELKKDGPEYSFEENLRMSEGNLQAPVEAGASGDQPDLQAAEQDASGSAGDLPDPDLQKAEQDVSGIVGGGADGIQEDPPQPSMAMQHQSGARDATAQSQGCVEQSVVERSNGSHQWCQEMCAPYDNHLVRDSGMKVGMCTEMGGSKKYKFKYIDIPQLEVWTHSDYDCTEQVYTQTINCHRHHRTITSGGFVFCESFCIRPEQVGAQVERFAEKMGFSQKACANEFEKFCGATAMSIFLQDAPPKQEQPNVLPQQPDAVSQNY